MPGPAAPPCFLQEKAAERWWPADCPCGRPEALANGSPRKTRLPLPRRLRQVPTIPPKPQKDLASRLGRGVRIVSGRKKGRIELEYYGVDDLNDLLEALALLRVRKSEKGSAQ